MAWRLASLPPHSKRFARFENLEPVRQPSAVFATDMIPIISLLDDKWMRGRKLVSMNEKRSGKSHTTMWTLSILAVPVLYVLTFPFVESLAFHQNTRTPKWFVLYRIPLVWAGKFEWFKKPLDVYADWMIDQFNL